MIYIAYNFIVSPKEPAAEILIAELGLAGFESFIETKEGITAYIQKDRYNHSFLNEISALKNEAFDITYKKEEIPEKNWNSVWEESFKPIEVDELVSIRAPFHENPNLKYNVVIEPKMSFGTGHHETTHMMVQHILDTNVSGKKVLDMGCGTGILAILTEMRGAQSVDAVDIDVRCYENAVENCERNQCKYMTVYQGDSSILIHKKYDIVIANINRNILLNDIDVYANCLTDKGVLLLSGFYQEDMPLIDAEASKYKLHLDKIIEKNNWAALKYLLRN